MVLITIATILAVSLFIAAGGGLIALLVHGISQFMDNHLPSAAAMAALNAEQAARFKRKQDSMEKVQQAADSADELEMEDVAPTGLDRFLNFLGKYSRYVALLAAWIATCGSLFMSEALGWVPCLLCWYQRILMYPLAIILPVGILRRDKGLHKYALMLSVPGACVSLYHYLVQKVPAFENTAPCKVGVPCSSDYLNWLGFVTIPMLALTAFLIITFMMVASTLAPEEQADIEEDQADTARHAPAPARVPLRAPVLPVLAIIAAVALSFLAAGVLYARSTAQPASSAAINPTSSFNLNAPSVAQGQAVYLQTCAQCHGADGTGALAGIIPLSASNLLRNGTNAQLVAFLQAGRATNDAHNMTGLAMPAKGGRSNLTDADLVNVVAYLRTLVK